MNPFKKRTDSKHVWEHALILDTCALIDGRIIDIVKSGFAPHILVVPQFIIAELQFLADHGDSHKRERARFGLDVVRDLQQLRNCEVVIAREQFKNVKETDDKLIALSKAKGGKLYTTDYNLNKVAQIEGVIVLNVNELAQALRPQRLPGERVELKITQLGQDKTQGVGHLGDGTMVVVEKAGKLVGQTITVVFSRMLQTQAGKMMFAVLPDASQIQPQKEPVQQPAPRETKEQVRSQQAPRTVYHARPKRPQLTEQEPKTKAPEKSVVQEQPKQQQRRRPNNHRARRPQGEQTQQRTPHPRRDQKRVSPEDALLNALKNSQ